jgi:hypothetical protein
MAPLELSLYDVHYSGTLYDGTSFSFVSDCLHLRFLWPRRPNPKWLVFTAKDVLYKSSKADIFMGNVSSTVWFFPLLFRQTPGPWVNVEVVDFRIRIFASDATPQFVKLLRANLVSTVLDGEILRLDDFGTSMRFSGATESAVQSAADIDDDGEDERPAENLSTAPRDEPYNKKFADSDRMVDESLADESGSFKDISGRTSKQRRFEPVPSLSREQDEVRLSVYARGLSIDNTEGRMYTFGAIDAQLRRNWTANRGSFVMIAKENRWVRVPWPQQMQQVSRSTWA